MVKEKKKTLVILILVIAIIVSGCAVYYFSIVKKLKQEVASQKMEMLDMLSDSQSKEDLLNERIETIKALRESDAQEYAQEKSAMQDIIDSLTKDEYYFDAGAIEEEIKDIGELATAEYIYTNVGTLDAQKSTAIFGKEYDLSFTKKTAIITMDGTIKVGFDVNKIVIKCDETSKTITITLPKPKILSNELDEDSTQIYDESDGLFNKITLEDDSLLRNQIKKKAEENAASNGLFEQAENNAQLVIKCMLEAIPGLKESYSIIFK